MPSAFGQSKQTACSDDLNSKYITFVASMNLDVSLVAAQPSRSGYRELSTLRRKRWPPIGPHRRAGAETSLIDFAALHMSAFGTKRTFRHVCSLSAFGGKADISGCRRSPQPNILSVTENHMGHRPMPFDH